ncbi:MAG: M24 family metallopeptidase [Gammaproteobacteria bacterium]|nr:M24 family metallopeptidase [Gammaproteobacteria bacterium]
MEHTAGVGWHAHGYLAQAPKLTAEATIKALQAYWLKHCKNYKTQAFENRLFHAVEIDAGFHFYSAKQAFSGSDTGTQSGIFSGKMDINNVVTVEPGIYIQEEGLGIRIENDVLITADGVIDFMDNFPIEVEDIEYRMNRS